MINRRYLRIKVLQNLYSLQAIGKTEREEVAEWLREQFGSYRNVLGRYEETDRADLKAAEDVTLSAFYEPEQRQKKLDSLPEESREPIEQALLEAEDRLKTSLSKVRKNIEKQMVREAEGLGERYLAILRFFPAIRDIAQDVEADMPKGTGLDVSNLVNNKALRMMERLPELNNPPKQGGIKWKREQAELQEWYTDLIRKAEPFQTYAGLAQPDFEQDRDLLRWLLKNILFRHQRVTAWMENQDMHWEENRAILRSMSNKTLKNLDPSIPVPELAVLSTNWAEDREFFVKLYALTLKEDHFLERAIADNAHNWAADRIALVDMIILKMALTEMIHFGSIPVKVTMNEYLELAKLYSSPKSKLFINGLLDRIQLDLQKEGKIKKSGRGLMDH